MHGKLRSRWLGPFIVTNVYPYGAVDEFSMFYSKTCLWIHFGTTYLDWYFNVIRKN